MVSNSKSSGPFDFMTEVLSALAMDRYEQALTLFQRGLRTLAGTVGGHIDLTDFEYEISDPLAAVIRYKLGADSPKNKNEAIGAQCSFCNKSEGQVERMIAGPDVFICNECVTLCNQILLARE